MDAKTFTFGKHFGRLILTLALITFTANKAGAWDVSGDEYTISSAADWDTFCDALLDNVEPLQRQDREAGRRHQRQPHGGQRQP